MRGAPTGPALDPPSWLPICGRSCWAAERSTFVVDADGDVGVVLRKVKPAEHDERVLAALGGA